MLQDIKNIMGRKGRQSCERVYLHTHLQHTAAHILIPKWMRFLMLGCLNLYWEGTPIQIEISQKLGAHVCKLLIILLEVVLAATLEVSSY